MRLQKIQRFVNVTNSNELAISGHFWEGVNLPKNLSGRVARFDKGEALGN